MTQAVPQQPNAPPSDDEWFAGILDQLGEFLERNDVRNRFRLLAAAKKERPHLTAWFVGIEFVCPYIDGAVSGCALFKEIVEKSRVINNITVNAGRDVNAADGAVIGLNAAENNGEDEGPNE